MQEPNKTCMSQMARYLETAAEANEVAKNLLELIPEGDRPVAACMLARLVNLGIRCSPRGVQHTVRLNAVREAMRGLPVEVSMVQRTDERTGRSYNALLTSPIGGKVEDTYLEGASEDE